MAFGRKEAGERCETEDGITHSCQIFEVDREGKMATGTDFTFSVTPENNCEPIMIGNHDILERDVSRVKRIIEQRARACRKGL